MADLLGRGAAFLHGKLIANASRTVTYRRGAQEVEAMATVGRKVYRFDEIRIETRDYLIAPVHFADFIPALPQSGDQIDETIDGVTTTYDVVGPGGEPEWDWSGPDRQRMRIHTQRASAKA